MKKTLVLLFIVITSFRVSYADTWAKPVEQLYLSENKEFIAQVTPAKDNNSATLKVFLVRGHEGWVNWRCNLGNEGAPQYVYLTDDGRYVVTVNENSRRVHGGMGDFVLAFYNRKGLLKNYSLEQILHYPDDINEQEFRKLTSRSVSGRAWVSKPMFLDEYNGKLYFCVWLFYGKRWLAWEVSNGEEVKINENMVEHWNRKGRLWALKEIKKGTDYYWTPYKFLGKLKNPTDRVLIEDLLSDDVFSESGWRSRDNHLIRYSAASQKRLLAEKILANWDGRTVEKHDSSRELLYYLGKIEGVVTLPRTNDPNRATLWIYLIPSTVLKDQWHKQSPIQRLVISFSRFIFRNYDLEYTQKFPFAISTVTPGKYWIKSVLDKTKPFSKPSDKICIPQKGDYQSFGSPVVAIRAGKTLENIVIDCTHKVIDGID